MPEHPQSNGIAERLMGVLEKVVHAAVARGQDPRVEIRRRLLNHRNNTKIMVSQSQDKKRFLRLKSAISKGN